MLNKCVGRMFSSVGWTWNPLAGCIHDCPYCYARRQRAKWGKDFKPVFRENFLKDKLPDDGTWIFVGSMGDTFCKGFTDDQILALLSVIENYDGSNKFLLQTKNPHRFRYHAMYPVLQRIREKVILGTTIETNRKTLGRAPSTYLRRGDLAVMKEKGFKTFLSMEPLADFDQLELREWINEIEPEAIEIGLENYTQYQIPPPESKILLLLEWLRMRHIPFVLKENLKHLEGEG